MMSRIDDMTYDEIATKLDISTNTVKYHIKTALQKLRDGMGNIFIWLIILLNISRMFLIYVPILFLIVIVFKNIALTALN
jgi:orotate phosphoribosyltransferase-like protein